MPKRFLEIGAGNGSCSSKSICARSSFNCSEVIRTRRDRCTAAQRGVGVMGRMMEEEAMSSEGSCACALPELTSSATTRRPRIQRSYGCSSTYVLAHQVRIHLDKNSIQWHSFCTRIYVFCAFLIFVTMRLRITPRRPRLPLNARPLDELHYQAALACFAWFLMHSPQTLQARHLLCASSLLGEGQKAACHGRLLRGPRTCPQSRVCFRSAGADKQLEGHRVELDAFSYAYAG
jgi:hypothetical protein